MFTLRLSLILITLAILNGCAAVVVGGAATGASMAHDRRTVGTVVDDQGIELKALKELVTDARIRKNTHINVTSYNRIVLLTGEAPSEALRNSVISKIRSIPNIKKIQNEIIIAAPSALLSRSSDSIITSNVKLALFQISSIQNFDPSRVKVITENGTVFLMGLIREAEAEAVVNLVRRINGVQRVVKFFELRR